MNLRHTAALTLVGWYLMVPPVESDKSVRPELPLSQWIQSKSYDTASECQEDLDNISIVVDRLLR
jgi:hypothetical protein